ncbi:MAG TPA: peroxiredoxin [Chloroflexia bacterium]|nr:peroxiredoxin [Chloroflexia bacterium]
MDQHEALTVGDMAPDFTLNTEADTPLRLSGLRGHRVVIYFYPQDDTPGCTIQACSFRDSYPQIEEQNAVVLGISPDDSGSHRKFKTKFDLPFTLLVDPDHAVADQYGAWGEKEAYGRKSVGLIRSQFIVDEQGRLIDIQLPVRAKESMPRALEVLRG